MRSATSSGNPVANRLQWIDREDEPLARRLAWTSSVCAFFLAAGTAGLLLPLHLSEKPPGEAQTKQIVPVLFTQAAAGAAETRTHADVAVPMQPAEVTTPRRMVANVSLPGAQVNPIAATELLSPLPASPTHTAVPSNESAPRTSRFQPSAGAPDMPHPTYPPLALRRGYEGTAEIDFVVETSGRLSEVRLRKSSGFALLDEAALKTVRERWRFPPGKVRHHFVEIVFQLQ